MTNQQQPDHVTPETAAKLHDLGAFVGWELRAGDWVQATKLRSIHLVMAMDSTNDRPVAKLAIMPDGLIGGWYYTDYLIFLPRLGDLLSELERVCSTEGEYVCHPDLTWYQGKCACEISDGQTSHFFRIKGSTDIDTAAACLAEVLENRREREGQG